MSDSSAPFPRERKTALAGGYVGRILRVDLTTGSMNIESLFMRH